MTAGLVVPPAAAGLPPLSKKLLNAAQASPAYYHYSSHAASSTASGGCYSSSSATTEKEDSSTFKPHRRGSISRCNVVDRTLKPNEAAVGGQGASRRGAGFDIPPSVSCGSSSRSTSVSDECGADSTAVASATSSFHQAKPNFSLKSRYAHFENAFVFVTLAAKTIHHLPSETPPPLKRPTNAELSNPQPHTVFRPEPSDPPISNLSALSDRIANAMRCKYPCYVLALLYLNQIIRKHGKDLTTQVFQRLTVAAVVVASKFYDDLYFSNEHYSKELGFSLETLNSLEICFLVMLDFNLRVPPAEFRPVMYQFDRLRVEICNRERMPILCGLNTSKVPDELSILPRGGGGTAGRPVRHGRGSSSLSPHCSAALFATAAAMPTRIPCLDQAVHTYLASREMRGYRFEAEEEFMFKAGVQSRCRTIHKLLQEFRDESSSSSSTAVSSSALPGGQIWHS